MQVLEREIVKNKSLSLEVFPMVLYRLGREPDPTTRLTILYTLPSLAVNKVSGNIHHYTEGHVEHCFLWLNFVSSYPSHQVKIWHRWNILMEKIK